MNLNQTALLNKSCILFRFILSKILAFHAEEIIYCIEDSIYVTVLSEIKVDVRGLAHLA
jgi:hypothetical protein